MKRGSRTAIVVVAVLGVLGAATYGSLIGVAGWNAVPRTHLGVGTVSVDAGTGNMLVTSQPTMTDFGGINYLGPRAMSASQLRIDMRLLDEYGTAYEGSGPTAFTLEGNIDSIPGASGVLLTGELVEFGFHNSTPTTPERPTGEDGMDWRFKVTGGLLAPLYAGQNIGAFVALANDGTWPDPTAPENRTADYGEHFASSVAQSIWYGSVIPIKCGTAIGDFVWNDLDGDGRQGPGEPGINGVVLRLKDDNGNVLATTTSGPGPLNQQGYYQFERTVGFCAGTWSVEYEPASVPPGFVPTVVNAAGATAANDSNPSPSSVVLTSDISKDQTHDFGFRTVTPGEIGDVVWHDVNRDGLQDAGEPGLAGVGVTLLDAFSNTLVATTVTGGDGSYLFTGVQAGTYRVAVDGGTLPVGFTPAIALAGSTDLDSNGTPTEVALADGESNLTLDFGYVSECTGMIGDYVWYDRNQNGVQDAGEPGMGGVTVTLRDAATNAITATTVTDATGYYAFSGLCRGSRRVEISGLPDGFSLATTAAAGSTPANDSNPNPALAMLGSDVSSNTTIDFGLVAPCAGQIGDIVWSDTNTNGIQDAGEVGMAGATVNLRRASDNAIVQTTTTNGAGAYRFVGLCPGSYLVEFVPPAGTTTSPSLQGGNVSNDSNPNPSLVALQFDTSTNTTIDFGVVQGPTGVGTGTPGYWMNHPRAWPEASVTIGGVTYTRAQAIYRMKKSVAGDMTYSMFAHLVAATLNVQIGNASSCISDTIAEANAWLTQHPLGSRVRARSAAWRAGERLKDTLSRYNSGLLCAPSRDGRRGARSHDDRDRDRHDGHHRDRYCDRDDHYDRDRDDRD
jgi:hypothetical protein